MVAMQAALRERPANVGTATVAQGRSKDAQSLFALTKEELAKEITNEEEVSTLKIRKALLAASRAKREQAKTAESQSESRTEIEADASVAQRQEALETASDASKQEHAHAAAAEAAAAASASEEESGKKPRMHTKSEASLLVRDAALHEWLRKRQRKTEPAKPRTYMTRHRRQSLQKAFESIDRDGSGSIDRGELVFALGQLGLDQGLAGAIFAEGDTDGDGEITLDEFYALVATVQAREARHEMLHEQELARRRHLEKQIERQQLALHRKGGGSISSKEEARQATTQAAPVPLSGGVGAAAGVGAASASQGSASKMSLEALTPRTRQAEAVAASISELVSKASSFPIGLLANAQQLNSLVTAFDPDGYERRALEEEQRKARRRISSLRTVGQAVMAASRLTQLPALPNEARGGKGAGRAASAPSGKQSTAHSRWLQRGMTSKDCAGAAAGEAKRQQGKGGGAATASKERPPKGSPGAMSSTTASSSPGAASTVTNCSPASAPPPPLELEDESIALELRSRPASSPMRLRTRAESAKAIPTWQGSRQRPSFDAASMSADEVVAQGAAVAVAELQQKQRMGMAQSARGVGGPFRRERLPHLR